MLKRILATLVIPVALQGAVTVRGWDSTSKEVVIRYTAPDAVTACTIYGSETNSFPPATYTPIADLDTTLVANANVDTSRNSLLTNTADRTVVIGKMMARKALTGYMESLALPAANTIYFKIDCGGANVTPVFATYTRTVPFGLSLAEPHPVHPDHPGFYGLPSFKWNTTQRIIDPEYGTVLHRPVAADGSTSATYSFLDASGSGWTNPKNAIVADSANATINGSSNPLSLIWNYGTNQIGSVTLAEGSGYDSFQLNVTGSGSSATASDNLLQVALSVDGGINLYTPWHDLQLTNSTSTVSYPTSPVAGDFWQTAGDKPIPRQFLYQRKMKIRYVASTKAVTIQSGDNVGENWVAGTPVTILVSPVMVCDVTAGTPAVVRTCQSNTFQTGDSITLTNIPGTLSPSVNGKWTITRVDSTHFSLDGTSVTGTFGVKFNANVIGTTPGNPPILYLPNSNWCCGTMYFRFENFTDTGWTALNGTYQTMAPHNGDTEHWEVTGQNIPNTFTGPGDIIALGTKVAGILYPSQAQLTSSYPIGSITDATHFTLSSGPVADITVDTDATVDPLVAKIRKKNATATTINIDNVTMTIRSSAGTSGGAAGGPICAPLETVGPNGKKGNFCKLSGPTWIASDGSESHYIGDITPPAEGIDVGHGNVCYSSGAPSGSQRATFGVNLLHPERIYCSLFTLKTYRGYDENVIRIDYEGDYTTRSSSEGPNSLYSGYSGYPNLPNCYGYNNFNDGTHARVINSGPCLSYYLVIPSIQSQIQNFGQQLYRRGVPSVDYLCLTPPATNAVWSTSTNTVWVSAMAKFDCTSSDQTGVLYVFDLGNELHYTAPGANATIIGESGSWERPNARWMAIHGGQGLQTDGWASGSPTVIGWGLGSFPTFESSGFTTTGAGPYWFSYSAVNGSAGANITSTSGACPAGNPWIPTSDYHLPLGTTPDGTTTYFLKPGQINTPRTTGCVTVTMDGEPCDASPSADVEQAVIALNPSMHTTKCGKSGALWIDDLKPGDYVAHQDTTRSDPRTWEIMRVLTKTGTGPGSTAILYRGGIIGWLSFNVSGVGDTAGPQDHTTHPHRFMTWRTQTPETGGSDDLWMDFKTNPVSGSWDRAPAGGHGGATTTFEVGSVSTDYGYFGGTLAQRFTKVSADWFVASSTIKFAGKGAKDPLNSDSHLTVVEQSFANNRDPFIVDGRPWQGYGLPSWTKVGGTNNVYLLGSNTWLAEKFLPTVARVGVWNVKNVSGPSSASNFGDAYPYTSCLAHAANECVSGSVAGNFYISAPIVDTTTTVYQASGNNYTAVRDLAADTQTSITSRYTQTILRPDQTGRMTRAVTSLLEIPRAEDSFKNWSITSNGRLMVGRAKGAEYVKSDMVTADAPPIVIDTVDRTTWVSTPVVVPPVAGADNVLVRFGYEHYGDPTTGKFYCTQRAENCVMAAGTSGSNPYYFETTDSYSGITYAQPLTVQVPAVGNRVLHWQIVYRNGSTVVTTKYGVSVVP